MIFTTDNTEHAVHEADCLEHLRSMPDDSVDMVMTSPPYENARKYDMGFDLKGEEWVAWAVERYLECVRVSRGLVAWVVEGRTSKFQWSSTPALLMADLHRAGVKLRKPPVYARVGIPGSGGPDWLRNDYEFVVCASGGRLPWSDNTAMGHTPKFNPGGPPSHRLPNGRRCNMVHTKTMPDGTKKKQGYVVPKVANPGNVVKCHGGGGNMGSWLTHRNEAPFPEKLAEFFVRSFCPPGGTVLDIFSGSGTTGAVALTHGRNSILVDCRESQCSLTIERLEEAAQKKIEDCA